MRLRNRRWVPPRIRRQSGVLESLYPAAPLRGGAVPRERNPARDRALRNLRKAQGPKAPDIQHPLLLKRGRSEESAAGSLVLSRGGDTPVADGGVRSLGRPTPRPQPVEGPHLRESERTFRFLLTRQEAPLIASDAHARPSSSHLPRRPWPFPPRRHRRLGLRPPLRRRYARSRRASGRPCGSTTSRR
jgi:hypothetical protein